MRSTVISAVVGAACLAAPTTAWAAGTLPERQLGGSVLAADPAGANGTVKIDGIPLDDGVANEPHVTCDFEVAFFNFDEGERANIVFTVHPPTGSGTELLRRDNVLVSDDSNGGAAPDPDETFRFSADQLGLEGYPAHPQQGYHVKLTVERIDAPGAGKHKVFWLAPCQGGETPTTPPATPTTPPATPTTPPGTPSTSVPGGDNGGSAGGDGSLPLTGPAVGGLALLGVALVGAGATLVIMRRRRKITWTA
ncbi:hypothetical protein [Plantactinospora sp. B6F1]|uniref:hypothetical protein n=1 Tax=Plantactinospora sp. B6F1 TaxID=3158971 RepID=UPI0032D9AA41